MNTYKSKAFKFFVGNYLGYSCFVEPNLENSFNNFRKNVDIDSLDKKKLVTRLRILSGLIIISSSVFLILTLGSGYLSDVFHQDYSKTIIALLFYLALSTFVFSPIALYACMEKLAFLIVNEIFDEFRNYQSRHYHEFTVKRRLDNDKTVIVANDKIYTSSEFKLDKFDKVDYFVKRSFDNLVERHVDNITYEQTFVVPEVDSDVFRTLPDVERERLNHILYVMSRFARSDKIILLEPTIINKRVFWEGTVDYDEKRGYWYDDEWHDVPPVSFDL